MARKPRIHEPGGYYHVILRGKGGDKIFFTDKDRINFCSLISGVSSKYGCRVHAFCLMNNHVHLLLQVGDIALPKIIQNLAFRHTRAINKQRKRTGHLFQGRYKAILADAQSYLLELVRYIHLNPVRARLAKSASAWRWSGHNAYLGKERIEWLTTDEVLSQFAGKAGPARERYAAFIAEGVDEAVTNVLRKGKGGGRILGDDKFVAKALKKSEIKKTRKIVSFEKVVKAVANAFEAAREDLFLKGRGRRLAKARAIACLLARRHCNESLAEMADKFGRDAGGLSRATSNYEQLMESDQAERRLFNRLSKTLSG
jgi:REP element-mobilizing transposase RayT